MDFLVKGVMIGGFALVAAPAEYRVTGVKTFIVSHDGVVTRRTSGRRRSRSSRRWSATTPTRAGAQSTNREGSCRPRVRAITSPDSWPAPGSSRSASTWPLRGSAAAALLLLFAGRAAGLLDGDAPPWLFLLAVVFVDVAHVWSTGWRVYADGDELRARPALYAAVPAAMLCGRRGPLRVSPLLFWRVLAYTAVFHFVRQQYGWWRSTRKNREEGGFSGRSTPRSSTARR